jgi:hypothetical protein
LKKYYYSMFVVNMEMSGKLACCDSIRGIN